jgi:hypothetical protein
MKTTRINTTELKTAVGIAVEHINQAHAVLKPFAVTLTDDERATTPRVRDGFTAAGRSLARAVTGHTDICTCVGYDAAAVNEDLDNVEALAPLAEKVAELNRGIADSRLTWTAEAYVSSLAVYAVAKVRARTDGAMKAVVEPLSEVLATHRQKKANTQAATANTPVNPAK